MQPVDRYKGERGQVASFGPGALGLRRWRSSEIDALLRIPMIVATLLVIPDLILEEQPLRASWHAVAVAGDWLIWLVFLVEFAAIACFASDRQEWFRHFPLAPAMLVLTPPFAPAAIQALRVFRLLRLLRVARGFQLFSTLLTFEGVKYLLALSAFLIFGGGTVFAGVESRVGHHVSTWDGIWWAIGTMSTEGSNIAITTDAGRAIAIVLMLAGIGTFSLVTAAIAQRFLATNPTHVISELSDGEKAILASLDELSGRLAHIEAQAPSRDPFPGLAARDDRGDHLGASRD